MYAKAIEPIRVRADRAFAAEEDFVVLRARGVSSAGSERSDVVSGGGSGDGRGSDDHQDEGGAPDSA